MGVFGQSHSSSTFPRRKNWTHGAQPFFKTLFLNSKRNSSKIRYGVHKRPPLIRILSQTDPVHAQLPKDFVKMYFNIILSSTSETSKFSLSFSFPQVNLYAPTFPPIRATWPAHQNYSYSYECLFWSRTVFLNAIYRYVMLPRLM